MAIWAHDEIFPPEGARLWDSRFESEQCIFCKSPINLIGSTTQERPSLNVKGWNEIGHTKVHACPSCGWWRYTERYPGRWDTPDVYGACGGLRELAPEDISLPAEEVRRYLLACYKQRTNIPPKLFEETVGSVFASLGYETTVTAYSGDNGIDVFLRKEGKDIGVQIKRTKNAIEVEQIRALVGALVLNGLTSGVFITTSRFQRGASSHVSKYSVNGYKIELVDADRFFDLMKLAQRPMYQSIDEFPINECRRTMSLLSSWWAEDMLADPDYYR